VLLDRIEHCVVLVAFIQGVVSPFHEDFRPLDERGGEETGEGADEDLLEESGVHPFLKAVEVPERRLFIQYRIIFASGTGVAEFFVPWLIPLGRNRTKSTRII
jgi:hypothetical protein